jgi:hypothetical protein
VSDPRQLTDAGKQQASHIWFIDDAGSHMRLSTAMREAIDFSGTYTLDRG